MVTKRDPRVRMSPAYAMERRRMRRPQHRFSLKFRPYQIQPHMIAPVLPGETLRNLLLQSRVVTDPLKPALKLVGWWCEHFYFYVKHRDLDESIREKVTNFVLNPAEDMSTLVDGTGSAEYYSYPGGIDWLRFCTERVVEEFFRDEGESFDAAMLDDLPMVQIYGKGHNDWMDSLTLDGDKRDRSVDLLDGGDDLQPMDFINRMEHWAVLRDNGLTDMDYEDFISTYGERTREVEESPNLHRPELLRYVRSWQYPTNIVEPTTGVPSTAVAWSIQERADKDRRFNEPGFIVGYTVCRPKVYIRNQLGGLYGGLNDVYSWLPAVLHHDYEKAFKMFAADAGPLADSLTLDSEAGSPYWVDMRDLYMYGDQFVNYDPAAAAGFVGTPEVLTGDILNKRYAAETDIDALFNGTPKQILADGVVHLGIAGRQSAKTPATTL